MRITIVVQRFPATSETFIVNKVAGLMERGHEVTVVCQESEAREWVRFGHLPTVQRLKKVVRTRARTRPRWLLPFRAWRAMGEALIGNPRAAGEMLCRGPKEWPDLYIEAPVVASRPELIHWEFGATAVGRMKVKDRLGCKAVVSFRGYDLNFSGLGDSDYYAEVWKKADGIHCLGQDLWTRAIRRGCPPDKKHTLIPPAIDWEFFRRAEARGLEKTGGSDRPLRILSVGRLEWKKGYEYALEAVQRVRDAGVAVEYRIVGEGSYLEAIAFARHQMGLKEVVDFRGATDRAGVREEMVWADVFLHAAVSEGFCNAVLEAQAMELPVVCSDAGGLPENVAHGATGFVTRRREPAEMAERMLELAGSPELRLEMGRAGRARVESSFGLEKQIDAFEAFYREVLEG